MSKQTHIDPQFDLDKHNDILDLAAVEYAVDGGSFATVVFHDFVFFCCPVSVATDNNIISINVLRVIRNNNNLIIII